MYRLDVDGNDDDEEKTVSCCLMVSKEFNVRPDNIHCLLAKTRSNIVWSQDCCSKGRLNKSSWSIGEG